MEIGQEIRFYYEHSDCYSDLSSLKNTFLTFINSTPFYGMNVICYDDQNIKSIITKKIKKQV